MSTHFTTVLAIYMAITCTQALQLYVRARLSLKYLAAGTIERGCRANPLASARIPHGYYIKAAIAALVDCYHLTEQLHGELLGFKVPPSHDRQRTVAIQYGLPTISPFAREITALEM